MSAMPPEARHWQSVPEETILPGLRHGSALRGWWGRLGYCFLHPRSDHLLDEGEEGSE